MKFGKRLFPLLLITMLFTGCAQNAADGKTEGSLSQEQNESVETGLQEEDLQENMTQEETVAVPESADAAEAEDEAYILTFEASTIEGEELTSECFAESKLTMLNIWATYCNPCLSEMPDLGEIASSYDAADFQMIGIISDVMEDAEEGEMDNVKTLIEETGADYPHLLLNESLYVNLVVAVDAVPTTFFVNQEGEVLGYVTGAQSKETWEELIDGLLAEME